MTSVLLLLALGLAPAPAAPPAAPKPTAALYERLGGQPAIGAVVDEFLKRVALDKRINARFINTDFTALRINLVDFVCDLHVPPAVSARSASRTRGPAGGRGGIR